MTTRLARSKTKTRKLPGTSPAIHFLRPVFFAIAGLLAYGAWNANACALITAAGIGFVTLLPAFVLHSDYRGKRERHKEIGCG